MKKLKQIIKVIVVLNVVGVCLISVVFLTRLIAYTQRLQGPTHAQLADALLQDLADALDEGEPEAVKALFSPWAISECEALDDQIDALLEFYHDESESLERITTGATAQREEGEWITELFSSCTIYAAGADYYLAMDYYFTRDGEHYKDGLYSLYIIRADAYPVENRIYWGEEGDIWLPGITIHYEYPDENFEKYPYLKRSPSQQQVQTDVCITDQG